MSEYTPPWRWYCCSCRGRTGENCVPLPVASGHVGICPRCIARIELWRQGKRDDVIEAAIAEARRELEPVSTEYTDYV